MLRSMTGFGSAEGEVDKVRYVVEIRSVNNRYFKAAIKLPEGFAAAEPEIEKLLRDGLSRGTVMLSVRLRVAGEMSAFPVNTEALRRYVEQLRLLAVEADPTLRIDLGTLLQLPGVCEPPEMSKLWQRTRGGMMDLIDQAVGRLQEMRRREGQDIRADVVKNIEAIEQHLAAVAERAPTVARDYCARLAERTRTLTGEAGLQIDEDVLAREVALFAERCDIAEEIARLRGHLEHFRHDLDGGGPVGRKLEFIAQEMLREANTIAAKANDVEISRAVVEMKTAIDRIKEQTQNVE